MKLAILLLGAFLSLNLFAGDIVGKWKTIDDKTKLPKSVVEITQAADGTYIGKVIKIFGEDQNPKCEACEGALKGRPIIGMQIITGMKKEGDEFKGGTIFDPKENKTYKCILKVEGTNLSVRGYIGISLIGRTQTWTSFQE